MCLLPPLHIPAERYATFKTESLNFMNKESNYSYNFIIKDSDTFIENLSEFVDFSIDYYAFVTNPLITKSRYFGELKWGKFTIYRQYTSIFKGWIVLKINGEISNSNFSFNVNYFRKWFLVMNPVLLTLFCISLILKREAFFGIALLLITFIQTFYQLKLIKKLRNDFIKEIEQIIYKTRHNSQYSQ
jgi:hypothetical protein